MMILITKLFTCLIWAIALGTCGFIVCQLTSYLFWKLRDKREYEEKLEELLQMEDELEEREYELDMREKHIKEVFQIIAKNNIDFDPFINDKVKDGGKKINPIVNN